MAQCGTAWPPASLLLPSVVFYCRLTPVTAQSVADGEIGHGAEAMTERSMSDAVADRSFSNMRQSCRGIEARGGVAPYHQQWQPNVCVSVRVGAWPSLGFGPFRTLFLTIQA